MNRHIKYLGIKSFRSKVTTWNLTHRHTHTHTHSRSTARPGPQNGW